MSSDDMPPSWPQCPPFPDFTDLEQQFLDALTESLSEPDRSAFRAQVEAASVVARDYTYVGFYTRLQLRMDRCEQIPSEVGKPSGWYAFGGGHLDVQGIEHGLSVRVWTDGGYIDCIEAITYGDGEDDPPINPIPADLKITRLQLA